MRPRDISSRFQGFYKKAMLINFTKFTEKKSCRSLFFDKVLGLKFKKNSRTTAGQLFRLNTLYSLRRPQPQNVTLVRGYSLMVNYKHFRGKYCESLRVRINKIESVNLARSPTKKWRFQLRISSVNVVKFAGNCGFDHIYWRNP